MMIKCCLDDTLMDNYWQRDRWGIILFEKEVMRDYENG